MTLNPEVVYLYTVVRPYRPYNIKSTIVYPSGLRL